MWQNYGISAKLDVDISAGLEHYLWVKRLSPRAGYFEGTGTPAPKLANHYQPRR